MCFVLIDIDVQQQTIIAIPNKTLLLCYVVNSSHAEIFMSTNLYSEITGFFSPASFFSVHPLCYSFSAVITSSVVDVTSNISAVRLVYFMMLHC